MKEKCKKKDSDYTFQKNKATNFVKLLLLAVF